MPRFQFARLVFVTTLLTLLYGTIGLLGVAGLLQAQTSPTTTVVTSSPTPASDPGVRGGPAGAGGEIAGLTGKQHDFFVEGKVDFEEVESVSDGLGPRMNLDSCAGCHFQPATGGTSPSPTEGTRRSLNPQVAFASKDGGTDT